MRAFKQRLALTPNPSYRREAPVGRSERRRRAGTNRLWTVVIIAVNAARTGRRIVDVRAMVPVRQRLHQSHQPGESVVLSSGKRRERTVEHGIVRRPYCDSPTVTTEACALRAYGDLPGVCARRLRVRIQGNVRLGRVRTGQQQRGHRRLIYRSPRRQVGP